ncbi:MAG: HAD family hydrolase [Acidobacteriota bacterium]|nr:HAD family hydrolase [Acidobacteriota bacterium]
MDLAIFDIDGTLIDSNAVDNACFLASLGTSADRIDWNDYPHHTDRGLTHEFLRRKWSRDPLEEDIAHHRAVFIDALRARITTLEEIRGARAFIELLRERGWEIALATGAWSESARLKLAAAGFPPTLPLACCDEWPSREEIVSGAIGGRKYDRIVVFGDGWWDVRAARNLNLPFIGVGGAAKGAAESIVDFSDPEEVFTMMMRARPPGLA